MYIYGPSSTGLICICTVPAAQVNMYIYGPSSTGLICIYTVLAAQG